MGVALKTGKRYLGTDDRAASGFVWLPRKDFFKKRLVRWVSRMILIDIFLHMFTIRLVLVCCQLE